MKNWKQYGIVCLLVFIFFIFIACEKEPEPEPEPVQQELPIIVNGTGGNSVTVVIKYMALLNTTPSYISKIQQALSWVDENKDFGNRTGTVYINIISGNSSFIKNATRTLDVGSEWLSTVTDVDIYDALTISGAFLSGWFTMIKINKYVMLV